MLAAMSERELHSLPNITSSQCIIEEYKIKYLSEHMKYRQF